MRTIIIGGGKTVYFLAKQFASRGYYTSIITRDSQEAEQFSRQLEAQVVHGDGSIPVILEDAGARRADVVLALTPHDEDNLIACQLAQRMFGVPRTVALVNDPENEVVFQRLGVTTAFSATRVIALLIEEQTGFEDVVNLLPAAGGRVHVTEISLREDAPAIGKQLQELSLPDDSLIATIIRGDDVIIPGGKSRLEAADRLIVVTQPETYGAVLRELAGDDT